MISSVSNPKVKDVTRLQNDRRFRQRKQAFVAEGSRWAMDAAAMQAAPLSVFVTDDWRNTAVHTDILAQLEALAQRPSLLVTPQVMAAMSDTTTPPGILLVLPIQPRPLPAHPSLILILDGIGTPGNLGTMLRTAAAAGADAVLLAPGCVDAYNPKVVRGSMGALLRLPVQALSWAEIEEVVRDTAVYTATIDADITYIEVDWQRPSSLIIGSEAHGVSPAARQLAGGAVAIPMHAATESLNAAVAAGVILFEAARQRKQLSAAAHAASLTSESDSPQ
ncbi:MAG TPA: RNA methyltransferase [Anaerolineae bacterium]|nr:RNA methyltransferase [Anaerolineae bacterium]